MASQLGQRVRLVKCPKCLKILQEDEDVPVYQCGGCSAILQGHLNFQFCNFLFSILPKQNVSSTPESGFVLSPVGPSVRISVI